MIKNNPSTRYVFQKSRTDEIVPALCLSNGNIQPLHSMMDPKREAQRLVSTIGDTGFLVFLGLGGGFIPEAALEQTNARILVIDFDKDSINELFANKDYSGILNNNRFSLLVDPTNEDIKNFILKHFKPALYNGIKTVPLRTRTEHDTHRFEKAASVIQEAIDIVSGDYSVQAHFGKRWFSNIIRNIKTAKTNNVFYSASEAAIAAAGPSLDHQLPILAELKERGVFVISTDTALGILLQNGIKPDAIVSIDCQHISYYHFMNCNSHCSLSNIPLILDIASPPKLAEFASSSPTFFSSGHPLALYTSFNWRHLPLLDTSGGNVTYACLSFAEFLGARSITLFGADFSYINSQAYAKGTYLHPYFSKKQNRITPLEAQFSSFLYRSPFIPPEDGKKNNYYETSQLRFYRKKLEEKASMMDALIICAKGYGAPITLRKETKAKDTKTGAREQKTANSEQSGVEFLECYRNDIAALPKADNTDNYCNKLNEKQQKVFTTLLPYIAAIKKRHTELNQKDIIEEAKDRSIEEIERVLLS